MEAAKTAAAEKKDLQDQEKKAAEAEKLAKQDVAALASVKALKADEAEKMGEQVEISDGFGGTSEEYDLVRLGMSLIR